MTATTLASECLHLASRLRQGSSQPSGTCWDEATEEATEHVARYAAWVRAAKGVGIKASKESSAAKGMEKASRTLKEAAGAMKILQDKISELQCSVADIESDQSQVEHLFGRGPEKDLCHKDMQQVALDLAEAATKSMEMTCELPGSSAWVQLPDPWSTAKQLEECAGALEQGAQLVEHLEAAWMALQCRHEATKAWRSAEAVLATASPMKRRRVGGAEKDVSHLSFGLPKATPPKNGRSTWTELREKIKGLLHNRPDAVQVLNETFHLFDELIQQLARLFEELTCLDSDVSEFHVQLLGAANLQAEVLGWKLLFLESTEVPPGFQELLETVLAVGDRLESTLETLQQRRKALVEKLKTQIEIKAALEVAEARSKEENIQV